MGVQVFNTLNYHEINLFINGLDNHFCIRDCKSEIWLKVSCGYTKLK
jgi:hypothetical protein